MARCKKKQQLPTDAQLKQARDLVGLNYVTLESTMETVRLAKPGVKIDFGGIGKGLALDLAAQTLKGHGLKHALIDGGTSSVLAIGAPPGRKGWTVRFRHPYNKDLESIEGVVIKDESLATSSNEGRYYAVDGKQIGHIFDPRTGWPVENDVLSATAIGPSATDCDALSTAFYVMGREKTEAYCKSHPEIRAILMMDQQGELQTVRINFTEEQT